MVTWWQRLRETMRIYLAGPMRGYPAYNFPAFDHAAKLLRQDGHEVFSPAERDRERHPELDWDNMTGDMDVDFPEGSPFSLNDALSDDTQYICNVADTIALLPGWEKSSGVNAEHPLAKALGHTVIILGKAYVKRVR